MHNLSLSGCGFLGIYHIGVISAFREHAPEYLLDKISGCSAGSLVAACAICDCCLGQMVSDTLEIALKARCNALGPLHPSFNIVDILRNGLRRILPVDAHKICTDRLHVSITRWRDGKNFLVNKFDSREELIQALICSTFVPAYSGMVPPKFRGVYYWDGGLSNNNPILDEETVLVSPFSGESDICPREESAAFHCMDFNGTNIQWSHENIYRLSRALFPPHPEVLKAICFRGYKDGISFLKSRNLLQCSCRFPREKISISSVIGEDINELSMFDSEFENDVAYDSEEDKIIQYAHSNEPLSYKEMPKSVCQILDAACDDNKGIFPYFFDSSISRAISIALLPWTLPVEFSLDFTKKLVDMLPKIKVAKNPTNIIDVFLIYLNFMIQKFTAEKYQYHKKCKLCLPRPNSRTTLNANQNKLSHCEHTHSGDEDDVIWSNGLPISKVKMCARHRVPSICGGRVPSVSSGTSRLSHARKSHRRTRSYMSNASDLTSTADLKEFKSERHKRHRHNKGQGSLKTNLVSKQVSAPNPSLKQSDFEINKESATNEEMNRKEYRNKVHFHIAHSDDELDQFKIECDGNQVPVKRKLSLPFINAIPNKDQVFATGNLTDDTKAAIHTSLDILSDPMIQIKNEKIPQVEQAEIITPHLELPDAMDTSSNLDTSDSKSKFGWDNYWDKLESNVYGQPI